MIGSIAHLTEKERKAMVWLRNEITHLPKFKTMQDQHNIFTLENRKSPPICELVLIKYSATYGNDNGYYDKYPMILIVRPFPMHFFGFNIHYLPLEVRQKILHELVNIHNTQFSRQSLFKIIYPMLDALVKSGKFNYAYKNYSYKNILSKFVIINPLHYKTVLNLPIAVAVENNKGNKK